MIVREGQRRERMREGGKKEERGLEGPLLCCLKGSSSCEEMVLNYFGFSFSTRGYPEWGCFSSPIKMTALESEIS